jgi:hypothetical protein
MNTNLIRAQGTVLDSWPVWAAFALYLVAFGILAMTRILGTPVA